MASLPQLLIAPAKATVTPPRDLLSATSGEDHGKAFAEALAQARSKSEGRRRAESRPSRDDAAAQPAGIPVTGHAKHTTPKVEHVSETTGEDAVVEESQGAAHAQATEHAAEQAFSSQGVPFRDAQAPADAVTTPAPVEGVEVAPSVTVGAAPAPSAAPADVATPAAAATTPLEGTPIDPTVPPASPTGEASATGRAAGTTTDLSSPVGDRGTDATGTTPPATGPVVDGAATPGTATAAATTGVDVPAEQPHAEAAPVQADAQAEAPATDTTSPAAPDATAPTAGQTPDHGPKDGHADHGRHLGQAAHTQEGQPLLVGKDLGAAGGQHLGRTAGPRSEAAETTAPAAPTVTGLAATPSTQATTTTTATTAPAAAPVAVPDQLFASLGRLVKRGDGTHRLTIKLQPEALGEVRVVLTVRDGDVSVKLSGSDAAQRALLQGASDLQRLLESVGAKTAQVVVGDASQQSAGWTGQTGQSATGRQGSDRTAPSYARPEHTAPDPTLTRARNRQSVLDVTV